MASTRRQEIDHDNVHQMGYEEKRFAIGTQRPEPRSGSTWQPGQSRWLRADKLMQHRHYLIGFVWLACLAACQTQATEGSGRDDTTVDTLVPDASATLDGFVPIDASTGDDSSVPGDRSSEEPFTRDAEASAEASRRDSGAQGTKAVGCVGTFGSRLTDAFGRIDGKVIAVVRPVDRQCPTYNNDHVVLEVQMAGEAYRMVVNVASTRKGQDPKVRFAQVRAPLPAPAWEDGWHPGLQFDYVKTLDVHTDRFAPYEMDELSNMIADRIEIGSAVSIYARSSGGTRASTAHLIHKNGGTFNDGAIVLNATDKESEFLLFHFDSQSF